MDLTTGLVGSASLIAAGLGVAAGWPSVIVGRPRTVLAILAVITLGVLASIIRVNPLGLGIGVDPSSEPLLPRYDPGRAVYEQATLEFGDDDIYVVAIETDDVFTTENLARLRRLTRAIRRLPGVRDAQSLVRVDHVWLNPRSQVIEAGKFIDEIPTAPEELAALRERALAHLLYPKTLVSRDGRTAAINVTFRAMTDGEFVELDLDGRIQALLEQESSDGVHFYVAGRPHLRAQAYHLMVRDIVRLVPLAIVVAALALWLMTGSARGMLIPLVSCVTATLWVFGAMSLLGMNLNLITLVLAPMLICVGSVYGVHVVSRFEIIAADSSDARSAALECLEYTRTPVLMAGFTTCIGYGALLLADIQATNELGAFSVLGVASVTLLTLTGVPAVLSLLPLERASEAGQPLYANRTRVSAWVGAGIQSLLQGIGRLTTQRPGQVLAGWAALTAAALLAMPLIVIDTDVLTFFLEDSEVRSDFRDVNRLLTGAVPIYVPLSGREEGTFREPEVLRGVERIQRQIQEIPGVSAVLSSVDLVKLANRALEDGSVEHERVPDTRAAVAEAVFMLPKAQLRRFSNSDHSRGNLVVRTGQSGSAAILALESRIREVLAAGDLPPELAGDVTGNAILINRSADGIAGNQVTQVGFAALAILLLVSLGFRSLRVGLLSMIPNIVPVVVFFGVLGSGIARLSVPTSLIASIALGIAIDDTVHYLVAYLRHRKLGLSAPEAARVCVEQVGRPICMTTIMLIVGFLVMLLSGFATLREFGYLTALTMAICLLSDLLLLPALLMRLRA